MRSAAATRAAGLCTPQRAVTAVLTAALILGVQMVTRSAVLPLPFSRRSMFSTQGDRAFRPGDASAAGAAGDGSAAAAAAGSGAQPSCPSPAAVAVVAAPAVKAGGASAAVAAGDVEELFGATTAVGLNPTNPWLTQQECFENSDETETCIFRGPVCITNKDQIVVSRRRRPDYGSHDPRSWCPDHRAYRRAYECRNRRPNLPEEAYANAEKWMHEAGSVSLMPTNRRRWGPQDGYGDVKEVPFEALIRASSPEAIKALGPEWQTVAAAADTSFLPPVGESIGQGSIKGPRKIKWLTGDDGRNPGAAGAVYFANMRGEWVDHIWHWSTAAFPLFDFKRQNRTRMNEPGFSGERGHFNLNTGPFAFPPMDYVVMFGRFPRPVRTIADFPRWMQKVWPALTQEQTVLLANGLLHEDKESPYYLDDDTLLCTAHGVYASFKGSLFSGQRDAHVFKMLSYAAAGVKTPAYGRYPPRTITVLTRPSRGLYNIEAILDVLKQTGMPIRVINEMGSLTWEEQVAAMANTGILVAVHGAALTNVIFLPANAVLIEVFPWMYRSFLYRDLAWKAGLQYYALNSVYPDFGGKTPLEMKGTPKGSGVYEVYDDEEFVERCSGPHYSSMDIYSIAQCTHRAKYTWPYVDVKQLQVLIADALDDIGCRESFCHNVEFRGFDKPPMTYIVNMKTNETREWVPP